MDCLRFEQLVQAHLDADLAPVQSLRMDEHAAACRACAALLADYALLFETLGRLEREPAPAGLEQAVLARIDLDAYRASRWVCLCRRLAGFTAPMSVHAQMGVAALAMLLGVWAGGAHVSELQGWLERLATWAYGSVAGTFAGIGSGFVGEHWPLIRSSAAMSAQALRLIVSTQRDAVTSFVLGYGVVLFSIVVWRRGRGGRHAHLHLV
jgi:predicted anti-sigma-YlaC factor YlaD